MRDGDKRWFGFGVGWEGVEWPWDGKRRFGRDMCLGFKGYGIVCDVLELVYLGF